ncbi:hypothetical protein [Streptomyces pinistramenti]|uniref:hypothetical protein n=1 Tax=Streptomyces pinistramenti TaxID=2884812 RepID=UPI001D066652|nr:hypothetical protein [Streptomyces pinistramenti]MCB5910355.1 hypothetical protein [Streptomyces pinistramenti]
MAIPEKAQLEALELVDELGRKRAKLLADADELLPQIKEAVLRAVQLGASRSRVQDLSRVSPGPVYRWYREAGLEMRKDKTDDGETN